jgi:hypothetical protein
MTQQDKKRAIDKWLTENYKQLEINSIKTATYDNPLRHDLLSLTLQQFLEQGIDRCYEIVANGQPERYITRSMALNLKSNTSIFYQKYRKPALAIRELKQGSEKHIGLYEMDLAFDAEIPLKDQITRATLNKMDVYHREIFTKLYLQEWTQDEFCEFYNIPVKELRNNVAAARKRFKQIYKDIEANIKPFRI